MSDFWFSHLVVYILSCAHPDQVLKWDLNLSHKIVNSSAPLTPSALSYR